MLLQYPKLSTSAHVAHYEDYRKAHTDFMKLYRNLYEEVCGFALIPEKFINEAEPVIDRYLDQVEKDDHRNIGIQVIADFINNFYVFMDETTEMFTEHQALAGQTMRYMERVAFLNRKNQKRFIRDCEDDYLQLIPELTRLKETLLQVKEKVDQTTETLDSLKPVWEKIRQRIAA